MGLGGEKSVLYGWLVRAVFGACLAFVYLANSVGMSSDHGVCRAMMNNVLLAYIPVEISLHVPAVRRAAAFWVVVAAWTIFYPNAPYVLTDYFHLAYVDPYVVLPAPPARFAAFRLNMV